MPSLNQADRSELTEALTLLDLLHVEAYVAAHNPSAAIPYHNLYHAQTVALSCWRAARFAGLSHHKTRTLLLAALFHDFAHSGGKQPDAENVRAAIAALRAASAALSLNTEEMDAASVIIAVTEYPYVLAPTDESQCIMRDADLCQILFDGWKSMLEGLRLEMGVASGQLAEPAAFAEKAFHFWENARFLSHWGLSSHAAFLETVNARRLSYFSG